MLLKFIIVTELHSAFSNLEQKQTKDFYELFLSRN